MFGHQTMFDGVWPPNIYRLSRPLACLANFSTEGRGKKSSKEGKCAISIFDGNEFYQEA